MNRYEMDKYYTALEIAEILGLDKNTILNRCKKGHYQSAIKTEPAPGDPHGKWLVLKSEINEPTITKDVATLTRQITPLELQQTITTAITTVVTQAVTQATEQLNQKLDEQNKIIQDQAAEIHELKKSQDSQKEVLCRRINETEEKINKNYWEINKMNSRLETYQNKSLWSRLFGK